MKCRTLDMRLPKHLSNFKVRLLKTLQCYYSKTDMISFNNELGL